MFALGVLGGGEAKGQLLADMAHISGLVPASGRGCGMRVGIVMCFES
jgi:hypothetical protein